MTEPQTPLPDDIAEMSFEAALAELEAIVRDLEEGQSPLDKAIDAFQRGSLLKRHCEARLREAHARIDRIVQGNDGAVAVAPAELDDSP